jgi:hypothetical protein
LTRSRRIPGHGRHRRVGRRKTPRSARAASPRLLAATIAALLFAGVLGTALAVGAPGAPPDEEGVRAAVEQANSPAVWGEALRRGDPAPLASVWADDPLAYFSAEIQGYRGRGLRLVSTLVALDFLHVELLPGDQAVADTRERWVDRICTAEGELRGTRVADLRDRYELAWRGDAWWVVGVDITVEGGSLDWTPATDADLPDSGCADVARAEPAAGGWRSPAGRGAEGG